ncbi:outer membrane protein, OmpA/MotB family [Arcticibacter svalbardensis MN12-7]|uniref:Outer membrane protein, OmpA/MotB family n=1 Tax=Arcticibacter svalbardensis MN12-7 TaxID=1150600 RepID=R9GU24_9SPHI|nr:DUF6089 family protein [Arcticibacter svalbardensis]EOR95201.1 outer membrane protein, OmpA/MotB family [Arcticibacter svalbardensis MN12-7]
MKNLNSIKTGTFLTSLLLSGSLLAQTPSTGSSEYVKPFEPNAFRTWSIGVNGGAMYLGSFFGNDDYAGRKTELGYGGYIKKQILPSFGLQADYLRGKLSANRSNLINHDENGPIASFSTDLHWAASLSGNFTLANINFRKRQNFIQPYATVGAGLAEYKPSTTNTAGATTEIHNIGEVIIPVGAGVKFNLTKSLNLDLGYTVTFVNSDNIDGYTRGTNDKYSYGHAGLEFAFGNGKKPQLAAHNVVADLENDYVGRYDDLVKQLDAEKDKNARLEERFNKALADEDKDGVADLFDKCPGTPEKTVVDGSGCPLAERKPDVKVYITEEDKKVVADAIKNLEFDFGKTTIRETSFASLTRVASLLINKNFSLKLAGHTDNVGSSASNTKLSKARAESVRQFLVSRGANASRIEATGYGEDQPIASNDTDAGRQQNRRVEFTLY